MNRKVDFIVRSQEAIEDTQLQSALANAGNGFIDKRKAAADAEPDFEMMRDAAREVRQRSLKNLDIYLRYFEKKVTEAGGHIHYARTPEELRDIVIRLCQERGAKYVTKGKSMVGEEAHLNDALLEAGITPWETDLGEYIIQLAEEPPSHIVVPALHKTRAQIIKLFKDAHPLGERDLSEVKAIVDEARAVIRERFLSADVGITGANMLIAETGTAVLCTNEGNGDLTACLPKTHIITTSFDRVIPTREDAAKIIRVLARSATGQKLTTYTSHFSGPKSASDQDGPEEFHIVMLDNRRSDILGSEYQEMLHCIRCGACMNHCPVYQTVGGHAYNAVYPGPMGAVLTPLLRGEPDDFDLPNASTFCGRCEEVCPVRIPLPKLMRQLRSRGATRKPPSAMSRMMMTSYSALAKRPALYRHLTSLATRSLAWAGGKNRRIKSMPLAGAWTDHKDLPAPQGATFQQQWRKRAAKKGGES